MSARCASCKYPLTISDSVTCYECSSHFHIDCAQLVGFPYYELSSDPNRNTFLCTTCQLLPLPSPQCDSDSDSDGDCAMPSRQLDYHLEGQGDFAKDMNEVKGTVQDLSDLCKDMLREINDLKSINLTLRCCVENLRHDYEERDRAFTDLKRRLEALELSKVTVRTKTAEPTDWDVDRVGVENEESTERYSTPEPEDISVQKDFQDINVSAQGILPHSKENLESETETEILLNRYEKDENKEEWVTDVASKGNTETEPKTSFHKEKEIENKESDEYSLLEDIKAEVVNETKENREDWDWKGNKAVELAKAEEENESGDDEQESETTEVEDGDTQGWEILEEEIQNKTEIKHEPDTYSSIVEEEEEEVDDKHITEEQEKVEWTEQLERPEEFTEVSSGLCRMKREVHEAQEEEMDQKLDKPEENSDLETYPTQNIKEEKKEEIAEEVADKAAEEGKEDVESSPKEGDDEKLPEGHEGEVTVEGSTEGEPCPEGEPRLEGESLPEGESHQEGESHLDGELHQEEHLSLEGEPHIEGDLRLEGELCPEEEPQLEGELHLEGEQHVEGESEVEGELRLGGQSPVEGEVQPPDSPLPREPHTEEDLWDYLKDTVSSVHPATVEEFVQNLIGTLQHVPAEYLKPVIEANIKRATSPSVTDGEHLPNPEGVAVLGEEGEAAATEESALTTGSEDNTPSADGAVETAVSRDGPEAGDDGDAEGYSAVEAAA